MKVNPTGAEAYDSHRTVVFIRRSRTDTHAIERAIGVASTEENGGRGRGSLGARARQRD